MPPLPQSEREVAAARALLARIATGQRKVVAALFGALKGRARPAMPRAGAPARTGVALLPALCSRC